MTNEGLARLIEQFDRLQAEPDERLLTQFLASRDEASFTALVSRHGPMVLGVCRRVLHHQQDAEDCFQATFIILARRASAVVKRASLASWLYGVAYRTSLEARGLKARRQAREKQVDTMPHPAITNEEPNDWQPLLDEELNRLPEKYRVAIILCDLEGRPRRDAALLLGIPEGTLSSRLATARSLLAKRLSGKGLVVSGGTLAACLTAETVRAALPASLVMTTSKVAVLAAAGQLAANATTAVVLTGEVMKAMFMSKLKTTLAVVLVGVALGVTGITAHFTSGSAAHAQAAPKDGKPVSELEALKRENALLKLNLRVTLEKLEAMEESLKRAEDKSKAAQKGEEVTRRTRAAYLLELTTKLREKDDAMAGVNAAIKALQDAKDAAARDRAIKLLRDALQKLQQSPEDPNKVKPTVLDVPLFDTTIPPKP